MQLDNITLYRVFYDVIFIHRWYSPKVVRSNTDTSPGCPYNLSITNYVNESLQLNNRNTCKHPRGIRLRHIRAVIMGAIHWTKTLRPGENVQNLP